MERVVPAIHSCFKGERQRCFCEERHQTMMLYRVVIGCKRAGRSLSASSNNEGVTVMGCVVGGSCKPERPFSRVEVRDA